MPGLEDLLAAIRGCRAIDLSQPYFTGVPHFPSHAPFLYSMSKLHGEQVNPGGSSSAAEAIALSTHVGTHIDALCHFSCNGKLFGGVNPDGIQSYAEGITRFSIDTVGPILRRGVLLDIAAFMKADVLPNDFVITADLLDKVAENLEIRPGDVVLLRTGWAKYWNDPKRFIAQLNCPGPRIEGARWLSGKKIFACGSETAPFEFQPDPAMPVHVHLLVENGIHIIECLNLEDLAASGAREFLFVASPLKIQGATASPIRPFALVTQN